MRLLCLILPLLVSFLSNAESILIRNVTILESTGVEENVSVLIKNGKIESVESIIFTKATKEIDGTGKTLQLDYLMEKLILVQWRLALLIQRLISKRTITL
jgi:hypothetical protein